MADITSSQFPTTPSFSAVNFETVTPILTSETNSGKVRRAGFGHSYYTFDAQYPTLTYNEAQTILGWLAQTAGQLFSFEIVLPLVSQSRATNTSATLTTSANVTAGARSVTLSGLGNTQNVLKAGDFFKFSTHTKVYQCAADVTSSAGGTATLSFSGGAVTSVTSGATITRYNVPFTVTQTEDSGSVEYGPGGLARLSVKMREVW
jgi:hypothetical protein